MDKIEFIEKLANLLGIEMNQPFQIGMNLFVFTEKGLLMQNKDEWTLSFMKINDLISNINNIKREIESSKFPHKGDTMYCPGIYPEVSSFTWDGNKEQIKLFLNRLCFNNEEEALKRRTWIINDNSARF